MVTRLLRYLAGFVAGGLTWFGIVLLKALNPFLPWQFPVLVPFIGATFPGGAPRSLYLMNHFAETWVPFGVAYLVVRLLSRRGVSFAGAVAMYCGFVLWSFAMVWLYDWGVTLDTVFLIGLAGTFFGGAVLYLWLVDPDVF